jgi:hypothetical protein
MRSSSIALKRGRSQTTRPVFVNPVRFGSPTSLKALNMYVRLFLLMMIYVGLTACTRPILKSSQSFDCGVGDRVISGHYLFCVYQGEVTSTSMSDPRGGTMSPPLDTDNDSATSTQLDACPERLPYAYQYGPLTLCASTDKLTQETIQAGVSAWSEEYNEEQDNRDTDVGTEEEPQIGVIRDADVDRIDDWGSSIDASNPFDWSEGGTPSTGGEPISGGEAPIDVEQGGAG